MRLFARASLAVGLAAPFLAAACSPSAPSSHFTDVKDAEIIEDWGPLTPFPVDSGSPDCPRGHIGTRPVPGYLEIVVDGSAAMDGAKWAAVQSAVKQVATAWRIDGDPALGAGLSLFSDSLDGSKGLGPYPTAADVKLRFVDAAQLANFGARVAGTPAFATASLAALRGNYHAIDTWDAAAAGLPRGGAKVVVFVTGAPPTDDTAGTASEAATLAKIYRAKGLTTFAVLLADGATTPALRAFVGAIAANGGGFAHKTCEAAATDAANACHFEVDTTAAPATAAQQLTAALQQARASVDPCTRILEFQPGQGFDPTLITVVATDRNGTTPIVADATDGWTFDSPQNPQKILLHGASCTAFKTADIELITACPPVP